MRFLSCITPKQHFRLPSHVIVWQHTNYCLSCFQNLNQPWWCKADSDVLWQALISNYFCEVSRVRSGHKWGSCETLTSPQSIYGFILVSKTKPNTVHSQQFMHNWSSLFGFQFHRLSFHHHKLSSPLHPQGGFLSGNEIHGCFPSPPKTVLNAHSECMTSYHALIMQWVSSTTYHVFKASTVQS